MQTGEQSRVEEENYGIPNEVPTEKPPAGRALMSAQEEKSWSILAHLSIFLNPFTGILGPVAALASWLVFKDRYQVAWLVLLGAGWALTEILTLILIGFLLVPAMALLTVAPFVHAAYRVGKGDDFRYPFAADLIEDL